MFRGMVPGRRKMRPPAPDQRPSVNRNKRGITNDEAHPEYLPVISHQSPVHKKKTVASLFKFGVREVKTKAVAASTEAWDLHATPEGAIDKSPTDDCGSKQGLVFPLSVLDGAVNGEADLRDDATNASVHEIQMRRCPSRNSLSSESTDYKSARALFDSPSLSKLSQSDSLTTTVTEQSGNNTGMLASRFLMFWNDEAQTEDADNMDIAQNEEMQQSALQSDESTDSDISASPVDKGKSVAIDSQSRSFDYSTARRWSWDDSDMESEGKLTQERISAATQTANDSCYNADSVTLLSKGNQLSLEQYPTPPLGRGAHVGRYARRPPPRLPYTLTIYQAPPQSLVFAGPSKKATSSTSKAPCDGSGDEASDDMDWLDKFIRDEEAEIARMLEEDRLLAEELQRIEDEMPDPQPTDYTEESLEEIIRRIDSEEEAARLQELELLCAGDAELAAELARQEQEALEAEQRREQERQEEESRKIGVPILARQVNTRGRLNDGAEAGVEGIRPEMVEMLKRVKELFKQSLPTFNIHRIDLIVNPKLQSVYEQTRREFERLGRNTEEVVLFHGTKPMNVEPYSPLTGLDLSNRRILTGGFKIGGVGGHRCANGQSMVISALTVFRPNLTFKGLGIYCTEIASIPVNSYNGGGKSVIALLCLPGTVSSTPIHKAADKIGSETYDSYRSDGAIYVIRRPCQTLPCLLVHYLL